MKTLILFFGILLGLLLVVPTSLNSTGSLNVAYWFGTMMLLLCGGMILADVINELDQKFH